MTDETTGKVWKFLEPALKEIELELVDIEYKREVGGMILRVYIERDPSSDQKVNLNDCSKASEKIGFLMDKEDIIKGAYSLEVSSPGVFRHLKYEKDFIRFTGERVKASLLKPIPMGNELGAPLQRNFTGLLKEYSDGKIYVEIMYNHAPRAFEIEISNIASANLEPEVKI